MFSPLNNQTAGKGNDFLLAFKEENAKLLLVEMLLTEERMRPVSNTFVHT
jgi:hypothetical protein